MNRLRRLQEYYPQIKDVRVKGLIIGMELTIDGNGIVKACMDKGLLIITSGAGNVLRFVPPLIINEQDVDQAMGILEEVFRGI